MTRGRPPLTPESARALIQPFHGVVTREQLLDAGTPRSVVDRGIRDGTLSQLLPGVFAVSGTDLDWRTWALARLRYVDRNLRRKWDGHGPRPVAALTGTGAARLHEIPHVDDDPASTVIACNPASRSKKAGAVLLHRESLTHDDAVDVQGIRTTSLVWTVVELLAVLLTTHSKNVVAELVRQGRLSLDELQATAVRAGDVGDHALAFLRHLTPDDLRARSDAERELCRRLLGSGIRAPLVNHVVRLVACAYELDLAWPDLLLNVELDGPHHLQPEQRRRDEVRDRRLRAAGWTVLRIPLHEFEQDPAGVVRRVGQLVTVLSG